MKKTEDNVRDSAKRILGFDDGEENALQGTGQITTFNQLGFKGIANKPDGWYLPKDTSISAIILETKAEGKSLENERYEKELLTNIGVVEATYKNTIGILYNGADVRVYRNRKELQECSKKLEPKKYYLSLCTNTAINKKEIYNLTKKINDELHFEFGIKNLYHRMIFTACALVATKEGAKLAAGMDYTEFHNAILSQINKSLRENKKQNDKLNLLSDVYSKIQLHYPDNPNSIDKFVGWVKQISDYVTSDNWKGEDVMGIFFNEFNRYKPKTESGQIFTPDHITSFMYRLIHCGSDDRILDAACGSGAFLVKAMCNMIDEAGGANTAKAAEIKKDQLFGIEKDDQIFALACANMLIHKDGKTNLAHLDSAEKDASDWIKQKKITKVLMNPPFERKNKCLGIVSNVLNSVPFHTECAFILPDKKLEKELVDRTCGNKLLKNHSLKKIIKLPENLFFGVGVTTSIFVFESGVPQNDKEIFTCYIETDGLETVKNQGRQDIRNRWKETEDYWIEIINKQTGDDTIKWIKPSEHLSYQMPEKPFEIYEEDFMKAVFDYEIFRRKIDGKEFEENIIKKILYSSEVIHDKEETSISFRRGNK